MNMQPTSIVPGISESLEIPGLRFRHFRVPADYQNILRLIHCGKEEDGVERSETLEDVIHTYTHLTNSNPEQDLLFAEVEGMVVGYVRAWWAVERDGFWLGWHYGVVMPVWRGRGIGRSLLNFAEYRLAEIAVHLIEEGQLDPHSPRQYAVVAYDSEHAKLAMFEHAGYVPVRYEYEMLRPDLENLPEAALPPGLEVRPVQPEHLRAIWEASQEAFLDHWGFIPAEETDFPSWVDDPNFDASHYQVAWQGDQVAGMVLAYIDHKQNAEYQRLRGFTEGICVRRPWRRQGLARALIVRAFHSLEIAGMQEAALTVDTQNLNGALRLYESVGFQVQRRFGFYRKTLEIADCTG